MKDKFDVFLNENGIKVDSHYSLESLLARLGFHPVYDAKLRPNDTQIQVFDCHGNYEMTNPADFRRFILPEKISTVERNWTVAQLLGAWINAKVDDSGKYKQHLSFLMNISQLATIDRPRLASVNDIALKTMLPDDLLNAVLPSDLDESDYGVIAKHFNVPIEQARARIKQYENEHYAMGVCDEFTQY